VKIRAIKNFTNTTFGNVYIGRVLDVSDADARRFIENGLARPYAAAGPSDDSQGGAVNFSIPPGGGMKPSGVSSPAGQALPQKTAKKSGSGGKNKKTGK
jgi:hypothetical protein